MSFDLTIKPLLACTILGTTGNDVIPGTAAGDVICGGGDDDIISGRGGVDTIYGYGPTGNVVTAIGAVTASEREDAPPGNESASTTVDIAGPGFPASDRDTIDGDAGDDIINGQAGGDTLYAAQGETPSRAAR